MVGQAIGASPHNLRRSSALCFRGPMRNYRNHQHCCKQDGKRKSSHGTPDVVSGAARYSVKWAGQSTNQKWTFAKTFRGQRALCCCVAAGFAIMAAPSSHTSVERGDSLSGLSHSHVLPPPAGHRSRFRTASTLDTETGSDNESVHTASGIAADDDAWRRYAVDLRSHSEATSAAQAGGTATKQFGCRACGKAYKKRARLVRHLRSHTGSRPFRCSEEGCGRSFTRADHLSRHVATAHSSARPYVCDVDGCGSSFGTSAHLSRHRKLHTKPKPHVCQVCGSAFAKKSKLKVHGVREHGDAKPYACREPYCGNTFMFEYKYKQHLARHGVCATLHVAAALGLSTSLTAAAVHS